MLNYGLSKEIKVEIKTGAKDKDCIQMSQAGYMCDGIWNISSNLVPSQYPGIWIHLSSH